MITERYHATGVIWRRAGAAILSKVDGGRGVAYPKVGTIFIGPNADLSTYYHELGHILYERIPEILRRRIASEARAVFPIVSNTEIKCALDANSHQPVELPVGSYILIGDRYCGLDHSGDDVESQTNEIWASLFAAHHTGLVFPESIASLIRDVATKLRDLSPGSA